MRVFIDANILFSAAYKKSATRELLNKIIKKAEAVTNPHALEEAMRNIKLKRPENIKELIQLKNQIIISNAFFRDFVINIPVEDIPILAGAIGSQCTHLWTGDRKHFGRYYGKIFHGVKIVSGTMLADELQ